MNTLCAQPRCPNIATRAGRCSEHNAQYERSRGTTTLRGYGGHWKAIRLRILKRDPYCQEPGCSEPSTEVDHILSTRMGGSDKESNLAGLCRYHNRRKSVLVEGATGFGN